MLELGGEAPASDGVAVDVTDATFMKEVLEASKETPVIVDFWAPWCGPCKTLGPVLEDAIAKTGGAVKMAKVNVDQNQQVAAQLQVQSIPAVFAFVNGQPVDGFMGAVRPAEVAEFVNRIKAMGGGDDAGGLDEALDQAEEMLNEGALGDAAQVFAAILGEDKTNLRAIAGLSRAYAAVGEMERARQTLDLTPADKTDDPVIAAARSAIELASQSLGPKDPVTLKGRRRLSSMIFA